MNQSLAIQLNYPFRRPLGLLVLCVAAASLSAQTILTEGHTDIGIVFEDGAWNLHVGRHEDSPPAEYAPGEAILRVGQAAKTTVPAGPSFSFLGTPGAQVYLLPEIENPDLLFLGLGTEELPAGLFANDQVTLRLRTATGPGRFVAYEAGVFGVPHVLMDSTDGISASDSVTLPAGGHRHVNWAFGAPGVYRVAFEASGTLATNQQFTASGPVAYTFEVQDGTPPVPKPCYQFTQEHVDLLALVWNEASHELSLMASDDTHGGTLYASNQCVVICPESMKFTLPGGTPLGKAGDPLWILPQSPYAGVPYVGVSAERLPAGSFTDPLSIRLTRVEGPGHLLVWQSTGLGGFDLKIDSRDGISLADRFTPSVGGHEHHNWGFTASGIYRVYFQASGACSGQSTNTESAETPFIFHIQPLRPFEIWQSTNWPCACQSDLILPGANPDGDAAANAIEYALDADPNSVAGHGWPSASLVTTNGQTFGALSYTRAKGATDCEYEVWVADSPTATRWEILSLVHSLADEGAIERVTIRDHLPESVAPSRFYQLRVRLKWPAP